jgi:hypothetical protein
VSRKYIDFISAYCDSWCERGAFTERCSHLAVTSALAMCGGDHDAAFELALGPPRVPGREPQKSIRERMADVLDEHEPSEKELDEIGREIEERRQRVKRLTVAEASKDRAIAAHRWLTAHDRDAIADPAVREAVEVIGWDSHLIHVKIMRALEGRDEYPKGAPFEKSTVQSDWNGSAKVALISIERSERAWRIVAATASDEAAHVLADGVANLRQELNKEFPRAMEFRRPGFDDPKRRL